MNRTRLVKVLELLNSKHDIPSDGWTHRIARSGVSVEHRGIGFRVSQLRGFTLVHSNGTSNAIEKYMPEIKAITGQ